MDDFAKAASDAWIVLEELIVKLPIDRQEKQILQTTIENGNLYMKSAYSVHCSEENECPSHCTIYALSQFGKAVFSQACSHEHKSICEGAVLS